MPVDVIVPKLGLTMEEGTVIEWHKADGERVAAGDALFTVETDKVAYEVIAKSDGFLKRLAAVDTTLPVGATVGQLHETADMVRDAGLGPLQSGRSPSGPSRRDPTFAEPSVVTVDPHPASLSAGSGSGGRLKISPVARRLAVDRSIDPAGIAGSGPGGVILKRDVESAAATVAQAPTAPSSGGSPAGTSVGASPVTPRPQPGSRRPLTGMRRAIAQRMTASLAGTAQMTAFGRVDMARSVELRQRLVADAERLGARITVTDLVLKCTAVALAEMPQVNAWIDGDEIVSADGVHIGLAVALEDGLVVPVIRDVDRMSLVELSHARQAAIGKARGGRLTRADLDGGGFTLSNFGSYGGDFETPILNPPQSAMLGIGRIADEAAARDGAVVIRPMMWISMTFDHRLIDGAVAGRFRARLKALLEEPMLLLAAMR